MSRRRRLARLPSSTNSLRTAVATIYRYRIEHSTTKSTIYIHTFRRLRCYLKVYSVAYRQQLFDIFSL